MPVASLTVKNGVVSGGGKTVTYGELVTNQALNLTIPVTGSLRRASSASRSPAPRRRSRSREYKVVGQSIPMRTIPPIVAGTATYVGDVRLPGMLHARVVHPPALGSTLVSVGQLDKKRFPNTADRREGQPRRGRRPGRVRGDPGGVRARRHDEVDRLGGPARQRQPLRSAAQGRLDDDAGRDSARTSATPATAFASAAKKLSATYEFPYEKHAPIGPTAAVADVRKDGTIYVHVHSAEPAGACAGSSR